MYGAREAAAGGGFTHEGKNISGSSSGGQHGQNADSCSDIFPRVKKLSLELKFLLGELESMATLPPARQQARVAQDMAKFYSSLHDMGSAVEREFKNRQLWERQVQVMWQTYSTYDSNFKRLRHRWEQLIERHNVRSELLDWSTSAKAQNARADLLDEGAQLDQSQRMINDALAMAASAHESLGSQHDILKRGQRALIDIANTVGLSKSLLRVIARREWSDRWLIYALAVFTLVFIWICYKYL